MAMARGYSLPQSLCDVRPWQGQAGDHECHAKAEPGQQPQLETWPEARATCHRRTSRTTSIDTIDSTRCSIPIVSYPITEHPQTLHGGISVLGREQSLDAEGGVENLALAWFTRPSSRHYRDI